MMYPFLTLDDGTEITHSELLPDEKVKIYIEKSDEKDCFHHMTCYLPDYKIEEAYGFSKTEVEQLLQVVRSTASSLQEIKT
ncbi:MAG: hypothetical protein LUI06_05810 [Ruminococcus sp.]|nr:hypothetical protein [Ruminococcus sp.]